MNLSATGPNSQPMRSLSITDATPGADQAACSMSSLSYQALTLPSIVTVPSLTVMRIASASISALRFSADMILPLTSAGSTCGWNLDEIGHAGDAGQLAHGVLASLLLVVPSSVTQPFSTRTLIAS